MLSRKLIAKKLITPKKKINLFDSGEYFLEIESEKKKVKTYFFYKWKNKTRFS